MKKPQAKYFLTTFALGLALMANLATAQTSPDSVKVLNRADLDTMLAAPEQLVLIDLRRPDELTSNGGFPVYLSIQSADLADQLSWIPKDRKIVTVSNRAGRAKRGAALLIDAGFEVAGAAGALEFEAEGGTLSKISAPAPVASN